MRDYVALLRGINVGGRNVIKMMDLRAAFEAEGFTNVESYIQSGNVIFSSSMAMGATTDAVEAMLAKRLDLPVVVMLRTKSQLAKVVAAAPDDFGGEDHLCDVVFLRKPLTPKKALQAVQLREGVDESWAGPGAIYFRRLAAERTKSKLSKLAMRPEYADMTVRNWRTTNRLLEMLAVR